MAARKHRLRVVLDTNVLVRALKATEASNPNVKVLRLWLCDRSLQLVVSTEIVREYLGIFGEILGFNVKQVEEWRRRFEDDSRCSLIKQPTGKLRSRDPDDSPFLLAAQSGKARYLISNDRDLLDFTPDVNQSTAFEILTPAEFLEKLKLLTRVKR